MAFQIKDFKSIVASMINVLRASTRRVTDFNVGSVARTLLEAPAIEMDQLYQEMFHGLKEAIPVATYTSFDFGLLPAGPSSGVLTFYADGSATEDILIQTGTQAKNATTSKLYRTIADAIIPAGATEVSVSGVSEEVGAATNCAANAILELVGSIQGVTGVANLTPFRNGRDLETEPERKLRFQSFISTLNRGTNAALLYGASTAAVTDINGQVVERAVLIGIIEPYEEDPVANLPGFVQIYVHNGTGGTSSSLVAQAQKVIDGYYTADGAPVPGWKAAGVKVTCYAASEVVVNVAGTITILPGYQSSDVLTAATTTARDYLLGLNVGKEAILAEIIERIMAIPGVYNVALSSPTADTPATKSQKIMPGTVLLSAP